MRSRGITGPLPDFVKFLPNARCGEGAIAGLLQARGRVVGLQIGYIDPDGRKSTVDPPRRRFALEKAPDAVFEIAKPTSAIDFIADTLIAEGLEDTLSLAELGRAVRIVGLPGIGTLCSLPVKKGERIVVVRDGDDPGSPADQGLSAGVDNLLLEGAKVSVTCTAPGDDANSILAGSGPKALQELLADTVLGELSQAGVITSLSRLGSLDYDAARKEAAERLGIRVSTLDQEVARRRPKPQPELSEEDATGRSGQALDLPVPEPWPEPVEGAALLSKMVACIRKYIVMGDDEVTATALWIVGTHTFKTFPIFPRLFITAPDKECGKSTLLDLIELLVPRPLQCANITAAALFRTIEAARPTMLLDEADTFARNSEELRGVIDSGHKRNGAVIRMVEVDGVMEPRLFSTWAPMALAAIKGLPGTIEGRSIIISLRRRRADEEISSLHRAKGISEIASKLTRWCIDNVMALEMADPVMPDGFINRVANNWQPLLAIAEVAGGEWPERARRVASTITKGRSATGLSTQLLADIQEAFKAKNADRIRSQDLVGYLVNLEDRPWAEINKGAPVTKNGLARRLKDFRISPTTIQFGEGPTAPIAKGYYRRQFEDAFARYLSQEPPDSDVSSVEPLELRRK